MAYVQAIEDDDADLTEVIAKKQEARRRREEKKRQKLEMKGKIQPHVEGNLVSTPQKLIEEANTTDVPEAPKKKRGRPRKEPVTPDEAGTISESQKIRKKKTKKKGDVPDDDDEPKSVSLKKSRMLAMHA
jgi:hypothetical protein